MMYIIFAIITVFLSLWGFADLVRFLLFRILKSKNDASVILISPIGNNNLDAEFILRSCCEKVKWMGRVRPRRVICLDTGMNPELKNICNLIAKDYDFLEIATREELTNLLTNGTK